MSELLAIFLVCVIGLVLGRISIGGIRLGSSGILLVGLVFGHFGLGVTDIITSFGLVLFVAAVGYNAGPVFAHNFKNKALAYVVVGIVTIITGVVATLLLMTLFNIPTSLALGMFTGALTSTPGLAAAIEATGDQMAAIGYGISYPFGVVGVVLFVQLIPKLFKVDPVKEAALMEKKMKEHERTAQNEAKKEVDRYGFFAFFTAVVLGMWIGRFTLPLPGGAEFSLGNAGGALVTGLLIGWMGRLGPLSLNVSRNVTNTFRELGLALFFVGTGMNAGDGLVEILQEYGAVLFLVGATITLLSMLIAFAIAHYGFKLKIVDNLGAVTGAMTSTPGLGALLDTTDNASVAASYASTYPVALMLVVIASQLIGVFF